MPKLLITILFIFFLCKSSTALGQGPLVGGWQPIPDVTDPEVIDIGKFAVNEHNKAAHTSLKFEKVVKGESQVVAGMNYNLTITAAYGGADNSYLVFVYDRAWQKVRQLVSFKGPI